MTKGSAVCCMRQVKLQWKERKIKTDEIAENRNISECLICSEMLNPTSDSQATPDHDIQNQVVFSKS